MSNHYTSGSSDLTLLALLLFALSFFPSCTRHRERETEEQMVKDETVAAKKVPAVTVATFHNDAEEVYFDLIANTSDCLGEDLWLGGKLESDSRITLASSGAISQARFYKVAELTATGLDSNSSFFVDNRAGAVQAVYDAEGLIQIQLSEGQLQLTPQDGFVPVTVAFQATPADGQNNGLIGSWTCE